MTYKDTALYPEKPGAWLKKPFFQKPFVNQKKRHADKEKITKEAALVWPCCYRNKINNIIQYTRCQVHQIPGYFIVVLKQPGKKEQSATLPAVVIEREPAFSAAVRLKAVLPCVQIVTH